MANQLLCPHCGGTLTMPAAAGAGVTVRCPLCQQTFTVGAAAAAVAAAPPAPRSVAPATAARANPQPVRPAAKPATAQRVAAPRTPAAMNGQKRATEEPALSGPGLRILGGAVLAVMVLLALGGMALLLWHKWPSEQPADKGTGTQLAASQGSMPQPIDEKPVGPADSAKDPPDVPPVKEPPPKKEISPPAKGSGQDIADVQKVEPPPMPPLPKQPPEPKEPKEPPKVPPSVTPPADGVKPPPEVAITIPGTPAVPGVTPARVNEAIAKGVQFLKQQQAGDGGFGDKLKLGYRFGHAALIVLALLESEVPANDPTIVNAAQFIRANAEQAPDVYSLSTMILALDRLGDKRDRPLIQYLAARVLAAQGYDSAWTYNARPLDPGSAQQLLGHLQTHWPWSAAQPRPDGPLTIKDKKGKQLKLPRIDLAKLPQDQLNWSRWSNSPGQGDLSNTQLAILALWAARRHGVPAECPLLATYKRYLALQQRDGGWLYTISGQSTDTMTCSGLLGLAMGHGVLPLADDGAAGAEKKDLLQDPAISKALAFLGRSVGTPAADANARPPQPNLYLLWSIERVAMLYDLKTIDGKDWYGWGAQALLANQNRDNGSWTGGGYTGANPLADTCFALLFLKRANLVPDLTENLRLQMVIRDPGGR